MKYLVDTCVWIDLLEDRIGFNGEPLGKHASRFIMKVFDDKSKILINPKSFLSFIVKTTS